MDGGQAEDAPRGPRASAQHPHPAAAHAAAAHAPSHAPGRAPSQWKVLAGGLPQADMARREGRNMARENSEDE